MIKQQLDDATDNIIINKNMIKLFIENQDNNDAKIVDKLNEENRSVYKQLGDLRREIESLSSDILLKNQVIEQNQLNFI